MKLKISTLIIAGIGLCFSSNTWANAPNPIENLVKKAEQWSQQRLQGQLRDLSRDLSEAQPHFAHTTRVANLLRTYTKDPEILAASYLKDVLEKTPTPLAEIQSRFGFRVGTLVSELTTNKQNLKSFDSQGAYLASRAATISTDALLILLADRLDSQAELQKQPSGNNEIYTKQTLMILSAALKRTDLSQNHLNVALTIYDKIPHS